MNLMLLVDHIHLKILDTTHLKDLEMHQIHLNCFEGVDNKDLNPPEFVFGPLPVAVANRGL